MDAEQPVIVDGLKSSWHRGTEEYPLLASLLGINLNFSEADARARFPGATWAEKPLEVGLFDARRRAELVRTTNASHPCFQIITTSIQGCPFHQGWCDNGPEFDNFVETYRSLRNNSLKSECLARGLGFTDRGPDGIRVNIAYHVRNGDRCIRCAESGYFVGLYRQLLASPTVARAHHVAFDSHDRLESVEKDPAFQFPDNASRAEFHHTSQTLLSTVCRFATADILVMTGSSLPPLVAAFLPPNQPLLVEERRKEATNVSDFSNHHHFFKEWESVHVEDGRVAGDAAAAAAAIEAVVADRLAVERQFGGC